MAKRLTEALRLMIKRDIGRLVEESFMDCHSYVRALELAARPLTLSAELRNPDRRQLDDAVFELLGVKRASQRNVLINRLYSETAAHFRAIRVTEIQKMEDRAKGGKKRFEASEQAADAWDAVDSLDLTPTADWIRNHTSGRTQELGIPDERPVHLAFGSMFDQETVYFGKRRQTHVVCPSRGTAELLARIASLGVSGLQVLPSDDDHAKRLLALLNERHEKTTARFEELVRSRTADPDMQGDLLKILNRWFVLGRSKTNG